MENIGVSEPREFIIHPKILGLQGVCPNCAHPLHGVLPIEPLFDLDTAAHLIPCKKNSLQNWLSAKANKPKVGTPLYKMNKQRNHFRYLRAWEIQVIRDHMTKLRTPAGRFIWVKDAYEASRELDIGIESPNARSEH